MGLSPSLLMLCRVPELFWTLAPHIHLFEQLIGQYRAGSSLYVGIVPLYRSFIISSLSFGAFLAVDLFTPDCDEVEISIPSRVSSLHTWAAFLVGSFVHVTSFVAILVDCRFLFLFLIVAILFFFLIFTAFEFFANRRSGRCGCDLCQPFSLLGWANDGYWSRLAFRVPHLANTFYL